MAKVEEKKKDITLVQQGGALAIPAEFVDLAQQYASQSDFSANDVTTPAIRILQSGSPQVKRSDPAFIEGALEGHMLNTSTNEIIDGGTGLIVIPCYFVVEWVEWKPKSVGGGLVKRWGKDESFMPHWLDVAGTVYTNPTKEQFDKLKLTKVDTGYREEKGKWVKKNSDNQNILEIVKVAVYFVFLINPENGRTKPAVIRMSSTEFKKSKKWNDLISIDIDFGQNRVKNGAELPFWHMYHIVTVPESNDSGSWFGFKISKYKPVYELPNGREILKDAKEFRDLAVEGNVKTIEQTQDEVEVTNDPNKL